MTPKAQATKKIDKLDFMKMKVLCIKGYYQLNKKESHEMGENIWKSHI